jgi:hypothetical protein
MASPARNMQRAGVARCWRITEEETMRRVNPVLAVAAMVLFGLSDTVQAQNRVFGFKGGITLASADVEDLDGTFDADNRTGWGVGAFLTLGAGPIALQPELNLLELGFEAAGLPAAPELKTRYLMPAVLLKLGLPLALIRPGVFAGAGLGIELSCEFAGTDCEDAPIQLETGTTDLTGIFGADVDLLLGSMLLRGDVRYAIGFSDIHEASDVWTEIKNRAWQVSVGIGFRL